MKSRLAVVLATTFLTSLPAMTATERPPVHYVIAVGTVPAEVATKAVDETVETLNPGDSLSVVTLADQQLVGTITLPTNRRINVRAREFRYGEPRDAIKTALTARSAAIPVSAPRWPQGLAELGKLIEPGTSGRNVHVLMLDSALYHDASEPRLSMKEGYPNGALITGTQALSPFGTAERKDRLKGFSVHFCHREAPQDFVNDLHQQRVEGAVALFVTQQGGTLSTFTGATAVCAARFLAATQTGSSTPLAISANETPAMVLLKPRAAADDPAPPKPVPAQPAQADVVAKAPTTAIPSAVAPVVPPTLSPSQVPAASATQAAAPPLTDPVTTGTAPTTAAPVRKPPTRPAEKKVKRPPPVEYEIICDPLTGTWIRRPVPRSNRAV